MWGVESTSQKLPLEIHREQKPHANWNEKKIQTKTIFENGIVFPLHTRYLLCNLLSSLKQPLPLR